MDELGPTKGISFEIFLPTILLRIGCIGNNECIIGLL